METGGSDGLSRFRVLTPKLAAVGIAGGFAHRVERSVGNEPCGRAISGRQCLRRSEHPIVTRGELLAHLSSHEALRPLPFLSRRVLRIEPNVFVAEVAGPKRAAARAQGEAKAQMDITVVFQIRGSRGRVERLRRA